MENNSNNEFSKPDTYTEGDTTMGKKKTKYIFVTGGVVSSLGKGLTASAIGALLESKGLRVSMQKLDPYLNVDPGTLNPAQHGEVYVLDDGSETDLDLGHYERMTSGALSHANSVTSGQIYETVLNNERAGHFLGQTVQVIPHITDEIKRRVLLLSGDSSVDIVIVEVGGTVGDIEGLPFIEALRQLRIELGEKNSIFVHLTLLPYLKAAGEIKTKPTQQSVAKLRECGVSPDIIVCRMEVPLDANSKKKIAQCCNIAESNIVEVRDVKYSVYEIPAVLHRQALDSVICKALELETHGSNIELWEQFLKKVVNPRKRISICVVGKYVATQDAYKSVGEALLHAGTWVDCGVDISYLDSDSITEQNIDRLLEPFAGILVPGGFGSRGIEGKILTAKYARQHKRPFLGICLGMQVAVIEMARSEIGMPNASSEEFSDDPSNYLVCMLDGKTGTHGTGGTLRRGKYEMCIQEGSRLHDIYGEGMVNERHRHRYEINPVFIHQLEGKGMRFSGRSPDGLLIEAVEIVGHPFFVGVQYHPEFKSKPLKPHPLFQKFIEASLVPNKNNNGYV